MTRRRTFVIVAVALVGGLALFGVVRYLMPAGAIEIVSAEYGVPGRTCRAGPDVLKRASEACGGFRPRCLVSVGTGWCGDPAPGAVKTLTVDYRCGQTPKRASAVEPAGLELACP